MDQNEVTTAFDMVLEEIEKAIAALEQEGIQALRSSKHEVARELTEKCSQMAAFRGKVNELQQEWLNTFATVTPVKAKKRRSRRTFKRLKSGLKTPQSDFRIPILQALVDLGGSAQSNEILDRVEDNMKDRLNNYDYQPLQSDGQTRWRKTANWARNTMVKEGLLSSSSPHGIWEITQEGRRWLVAATKRK